MHAQAAVGFRICVTHKRKSPQGKPCGLRDNKVANLEEGEAALESSSLWTLVASHDEGCRGTTRVGGIGTIPVSTALCRACILCGRHARAESVLLALWSSFGSGFNLRTSVFNAFFGCFGNGFESSH